MPDESDETQLDRIERMVKASNRILTGNGHPERGHVVRMDRLEGRARRSDRIQGAVVATVTGVVLLIIGTAATAMFRGQV